MEKQRKIYKDLIVKLFKNNFESAQFKEKHTGMMADSDFTTIRDEVEEEYFTKNRGIVPYIQAINYLRTKIEACTARNVLFTTVEDYICAKDNIAITPFPKVTVPKVQQLGKIKTPKGKKEEQPVHVDCKSPQSCKKCRIMRRMARVALKPRKLNRNKIKEVDSANQNVGKTEHSKPEYSDISDTETKTDGPVTYDKNQAPVGLPYSDHEYSRISFYGCGVGEETLNAQEKPPAQNIETSGTNNITKFVPQIVPPKIASIFFAKHNTNANCSLLKPRPMPAPQPRLAQAQQPRPVPALQPIVYHFKPNNGLRQPSPANFVQNANTTSLLANNWRTDVCNTSMIRPVSYANQSIFVNSPMPVNFAAPVIQRPIVRQPVLFVCETSKQQFPTQFPTH